MSSETIQDKIVRIRKVQRCFSCFRKFPVGTEMRYWFGKYEGDLNSLYSCKTCNDIMDLIPDEDGYPEGFVREGLSVNQTPEEYLTELKLSTHPQP